MRIPIEEQIHKYIEQILQLDKQSIIPGGGMGAYGGRFKLQRSYYESLPPDEKRNYEDAVIAICQVKEVRYANLGLYICSELADLFPKDWKDRVVALVYSIIKGGIPLIYENTISYSVIRLIREFHINSLIPFVRDYFQQISDAFKSGKIRGSDWETMETEISRVLISMSPEDFWEEFYIFHQDINLLDKLRDKLSGIIYFWISEGSRLYGLGWIRQLAIDYSIISDRTVTAIAHRAIHEYIKDWSSIDVESRARFWVTTERDEDFTEFLEWLQKFDA
jgi:hypothetical protein